MAAQFMRGHAKVGVRQFFDWGNDGIRHAYLRIHPFPSPHSRPVSTPPPKYLTVTSVDAPSAFFSASDIFVSRQQLCARWVTVCGVNEDGE